ncbi:MAG TPA: twin-arginine translocase TatA/TatE family subunit [Chthoniobacteraceae bacterium]|nr:twin-arginine translocase TatA/TatE family subunit [Chthoniobacteraceae bacterium]
MTTLAFGTSNFFGPQTLILVLIVLVFFGAKRLPELARAFGQSIREFQKGKDGANSKEIDSDKRNS